MFRRLIFESSAAWFTIAAFVIAFSIYAYFTWRALRMKRPQVRYFEHLPFDEEKPSEPNFRVARVVPDARATRRAIVSGAGTSRSIEDK